MLRVFRCEAGIQPMAGIVRVAERSKRCTVQLGANFSDIPDASHGVLPSARRCEFVM